MTLEMQLNQHQYLRRSLARLRDESEQGIGEVKQRAEDLLDEIRTLRSQVIYNANAANTNIDNIQDAFETVRAEVQDASVELSTRLDASIGEVASKVSTVESRAAQLGTVISSCFATSRSLSDRVLRLEGASDRHIELARAIQREVHDIASTGDELCRHIAQRPSAAQPFAPPPGASDLTSVVGAASQKNS